MNKALERPNQEPKSKWVRKDVYKAREAREWAKWESQQNPHLGY